MGISVVSSWEASERPLQVRRDALCSVGFPNCSKVRANGGDKCLDQEKSKQGAAAGNSLKIENWILSFLICDSHHVTRCFKNVHIQEDWVPKNLDDREYLSRVCVLWFVFGLWFGWVCFFVFFLIVNMT